MSNIYQLLQPDGSFRASDHPGTLGGNSAAKIYGSLECGAARRALAQGGYREHRVFFADEPAAIAAGYRPCGNCMREAYSRWRQGGEPGMPGYPWLRIP